MNSKAKRDPEPIARRKAAASEHAEPVAQATLGTEHADAITRHRDQTMVHSALMQAIKDLLWTPSRRNTAKCFGLAPAPDARAGVEVTGCVSLTPSGIGIEETDSECALPEHAFECLGLQTVVPEPEHPETKGPGRHRTWFPAVHDGSPVAVVLVETAAPLSARKILAIASLVRLYANYLSLLTYAQIDNLTGLLNRKTFDDSLSKMLAARAAARRAAESSDRRAEPDDGSSDHWIAVVDLDHFKRINDTMGHPFGDRILAEFASAMRRCFRKRDRLFRFGGEEFVVIVRGAAEAHVAGIFDRFLQTLRDARFPEGCRVTASVGYTRITHSDIPSAALGRADRALYHAKRSGRDRVEFEA